MQEVELVSPAIDAEELVETNQAGDAFVTLKQIVRACRERLKNRFDVAIAITGDEGVGKSHLAIQLCMGLDAKFEMMRNVLFDPDLPTLNKLVNELPLYSGIVVDETIRIGYKRNWASQGNRDLNILYAVCRKQYKASFFCIPRFTQLDSDLQKRMLLWIHIPVRGYAVIFKKENNPFSPDVWNIADNYKKMHLTGWVLTGVKQDLAFFLNRMRRTPNFVGVLRFNALPLELEEQYLNLTKSFEIGKIDQGERGRTALWRNAAKKALAELVKKDWTQQQLVELTGLTKNTLSDALREESARPSDLRVKRVQEEQAARFFLNKPTEVV